MSGRPFPYECGDDRRPHRLTPPTLLAPALSKHHAALPAIAAAVTDGADPATCAYVARRHLAHPVWASWALAMLGLAEPLVLPLAVVSGQASLPLALPERPGFALDGLAWPAGPGPWRFGWDATSLWLDRPSAHVERHQPSSAARRAGLWSLCTAGFALLLGAPAVVAREVPYRPVRGETLRQVAERLWGDAGAWRSLWAVNRDRVRNPGFLAPGTELRVPDRPGHPGPLPANPLLVRRGDTLWDLAGRIYGDSLAWPVLWGWNRQHIRDPHWIFPDQPVYWRLHGTLHIVRPGDTLRSVARQFWGSDEDWEWIWVMNRGWLRDASRLPSGARLWVPQRPR